MTYWHWVILWIGIAVVLMSVMPTESAGTNLWGILFGGWIIYKINKWKREGSYSIYHHPAFNYQIIPKGFSWQTALGGCFYFFYKRCYALGFIFLGLAILIIWAADIKLKHNAREHGETLAAFAIFNTVATVTDELPKNSTQFDRDLYQASLQAIFSKEEEVTARFAETFVQRKRLNYWGIGIIIILATWFIFSPFSGKFIEKDFKKRGFAFVCSGKAESGDQLLAYYLERNERESQVNPASATSRKQQQDRTEEVASNEPSNEPGLHDNDEPQVKPASATSGKEQQDPNIWPNTIV